MTRVAFVASGGADSAVGERARSLAARLGAEFSAAIVCCAGGRVKAFRAVVLGLLAARPRVVYVFDLGIAGVTAALAYRRATGWPVVVDTGGAVAELLWSTARVGAAGS